MGLQMELRGERKEQRVDLKGLLSKPWSHFLDYYGILKRCGLDLSCVENFKQVYDEAEEEVEKSRNEEDTMIQQRNLQRAGLQEGTMTAWIRTVLMLVVVV